MQKMPIIEVLIVHYRTFEQLRDCLEVLTKEEESEYRLRISIVDNDSQDGSFKKIRDLVEIKGWHEKVYVYQSDRNGGFAYGNNYLILKSRENALEQARYYLLLNPDAIPKTSAIKKLVLAFTCDEKIAIAGGCLQDPDGSGHDAGRFFLSPEREFVTNAHSSLINSCLKKKETVFLDKKVRACDWVSGAFMMIRRDVVEQIGLMDEGYFLYFEEVDYCRQVQEAGWKVCVVEDAIAIHDEGSSTGIRTSERRTVHWYDSRRRYFRKHFGLMGLMRADLFWILGRIFLFVKSAFKGRQALVGPRYFARDLLIGDVLWFLKIKQ